MNEKKQAAAKMLYEIAWIEKDGTLRRGGLKATIATVGRWIEDAMRIDQDSIYMAVPANEDAFTLAEWREITREETA